MGSELSSRHHEGTRLLTVRLTAMKWRMALSWEDPYWAVKGLSVELGYDPTCSNIVQSLRGLCLLLCSLSSGLLWHSGSGSRVSALTGLAASILPLQSRPF